MSRALPLSDRLAALREAVEVADGRLELPGGAGGSAQSVPELAVARATLAKAGAREALGDATVVALAGATGSGKSTLFNALSGSEVSTPGVRRPTTGVAHATTWGAGQDRLLDWLEVPRRHQHPTPELALDGLVLLDLPDHDSTRMENRLEVDRLVELVDVLVWVLDPQKYADAAVHDRYLAPLAGHAGVLLVVLNQVDRLDATAGAACLSDLRRLLDGEGLGKVAVLPVSARTGQGVPELRAHLTRRVADRKAAGERLSADVRRAATGLQTHCGDTRDTELGKADRDALIRALSDASGVPVVAGAVERSARRRGAAATGWPLVRWVGKLRPDPLKRLHVGDAAARTSLPEPTAAQRAAVSTALRRARDSAGEHLPQAWRDDLRRTVDLREEQLAGRLDSAVAGTDLGPERTPLWQQAVGVLQWLLVVTALVGALWLLGLAGLAYLQLDRVFEPPRVDRFPLPTLLLIGGLLAGALLGIVTRPLVRIGARRRRRVAERRLHKAVTQTVETGLLEPLAAAGSDHARFCAAVRRAASS